jgi:hypothetical protein
MLILSTVSIVSYPLYTCLRNGTSNSLRTEWLFLDALELIYIT